MKETLSVVLLFFAILNLHSQDNFIRGVDISSLPIIDENNGLFFQVNQPVDPLQLFKENGANYVRLRLWHTPSDGNYNLDYNLHLAQRIKDAGLNLLLDIFYSDTWADPTNQTKPGTWENLSFEELNDSVFHYTANGLSIFKSRNMLPKMIQLGNEINNGMLWDDGRNNSSAQWDKFAQLLKSAYNGAQSILAPSDSVKIILHSATGGDVDATRWFYDNIVERGVEFDVIGLSYYPWWHGTLYELSANLDDAATRYNKEIIIVETAYPFTLDWNDNTHNPVGMESQLLEDYPATPEGQRHFLLDEIEVIKNTTNNLGVGWFYWEPAFITSDFGSPWENLALFDFNGEALPAIDVFNFIPTSVVHEKEIVFYIELGENYPNPFNELTRFQYAFSTSFDSNQNGSDTERFVKIIVYNSIGQKITTLLETTKTPGIYDVEFNAGELPNGIYFYQLQIDDLVQTRKMILLK